MLPPASSSRLAPPPAMSTCDLPSLYAVHTDVFDGPMELLLFLVRREGVDLRDVAIAPIADAFCAQVELLEALDLDHASDFLVMAATLCWLKSRELMPRPQTADAMGDEEALDVREDLHRRLLEYQRYKEAAGMLDERPMLGRDVYAPIPPPIDENLQRPVNPGTDALGLLQVYYDVLSRQRDPAPVLEVELEHYSIAQMATWILDRIDASPRELNDLLHELEHRSDRVVAFLASLEMARLNLLHIDQEGHLEPVVLRAAVRAAEADLTALSGTEG